MVTLGGKETFQTSLAAEAVGSRRESANPSESNSSRPSVHSVHSPHLGEDDSPNSERRSGELIGHKLWPIINGPLRVKYFDFD